VINAVEIELRRAAAIESRFDWDAIANFQWKRAAVRAPAMAPMRSFTKLFHWSSGTTSSVMTCVGFPDRLQTAEEVLFILIDAAEPVIVGDGFNAGNSQDFVAMGNRH